MVGPEVLCHRSSHHCGRTLLIVDASGDGEGVKIGWEKLVPKARTSIFYDESSLVEGSVLGLESKLVVRSNEGKGSMYSPSISSPSKVENITS